MIEITHLNWIQVQSSHRFFFYWIVYIYLIESIGSVWDQFTQENLLVTVQRIDDKFHHTADFGLEDLLFSLSNEMNTILIRIRWWKMFLSEILLDKNYRKSADSRLGKRGGEGNFRYLHTDFVKLTLETKTIPKHSVLAEVSFTVIFLSQNVYFQVRLVNTRLSHLIA